MMADYSNQGNTISYFYIQFTGIRQIYQIEFVGRYNDPISRIFMDRN